MKKQSFPKERRVILNRAQCAECKDIITSYHVHDYVQCKCGAIAVDGGNEYLRRVGLLSSMIEMCEYDDGSKDYENVVSESEDTVSETPVRRACRNAHVLRRLEKRKKSRRIFKE